MSRIRGWCLLLALAAGSTASAQDAADRAYAQGVHQYFAGLSWDAYHSFSVALGAGSRDPRCFYFRGLANQRLGRTYEALADFDAGAYLEYGPSAGLYPIDRSLERVQGWGRVQLQQRRVQARSFAEQQAQIEVVPSQPGVAAPPVGPAAPPPVEATGLTIANPFAERDPFGDFGAKVEAAPPAAAPQPGAPAVVAPKPEAAPTEQPRPAAPVAPAMPEVKAGSGAGGAKAFGGMLEKVFGGLIPKVSVPQGLPGISPTDPPAPQAPPPQPKP